MSANGKANESLCNYESRIAIMDGQQEDPLLGFLFGNIGEDDELEDEYELDKVCISLWE